MYTRIPVETLLAQVLENVPFVLDDAFKGKTITGYLPVITRRQALQQIVFVLGAMVSSRADGALCLFPLPEQVSASFSGNHIFPGATVKTSPTIARVQVYSHSYTPVSEEEKLVEDTVSGTNQLFVFSDPHHTYAISGGTISDSGANWVRITADGFVTLTAKKYTHTKSVYIQQNPLATAAEQSNVVTVSDATLVCSENVQSVLNRLFAIMQMQSTLQQDAVINGQKAGLKVTSANPWGTNTEGYITSMESTLTQSGHTAQVTIQGKEVSGG